MGKVEVQFSDEDIKKGQAKWINERKMYKVTFCLEVSLFSERGDIKLQALHNGSPVGQTTIQFDQNFDGLVAAPDHNFN
jgi:hypothetical protein